MEKHDGSKPQGHYRWWPGMSTLCDTACITTSNVNTGTDIKIHTITLINHGTIIHLDNLTSIFKLTLTIIIVFKNPSILHMSFIYKSLQYLYLVKIEIFNYFFD